VSGATAYPCLLPIIACVFIVAETHGIHMIPIVCIAAIMRHAERPARSEDGRAATGAGGIFVLCSVGSMWRGGVWDCRTVTCRVRPAREGPEATTRNGGDGNVERTARRAAFGPRGDLFEVRRNASGRHNSV
jgi:hypothetical protein